MTQLVDHILNVPDFPKAGVMFRDITPLLRKHFSETVHQLADLFTDEEWAKTNYVAGIEARGFILAAGVAAIKNKGLVVIRKQGKLPGRVVSQSYGLEYNTDTLEMQYGEGNLIIIDDVLATGGTLKAAADLALTTGHQVIGMTCLINLKYLNQFTWREQNVRTLIDYEN